MKKAFRNNANAFAAALNPPGGQPADYFHITIECYGARKAVVAKYDGTNGGKVTRRLKSFADYVSFIGCKRAERRRRGLNDEVTIMCSSVIDFPREETNDKAVIDLCDSIRGNHLGEKHIV